MECLSYNAIVIYTQNNVNKLSKPNSNTIGKLDKFIHKCHRVDMAS